MKTEDQIDFLVELQNYADRGVTFWLQDKQVSPQDIVDVCGTGADSGIYMRDYIWNEAGEIRELRFDKVINH